MPVSREQSGAFSICRENVVLTGWTGVLTSVGAQRVDVNLTETILTGQGMKPPSGYSVAVTVKATGLPGPLLSWAPTGTPLARRSQGSHLRQARLMASTRFFS